MTYVKELPICLCRFGRSEMVEVIKEGIEKKVARLIMACGYRETDPEECILCGGFKDVKLELKVDTFVRIIGRKKNYDAL